MNQEVARILRELSVLYAIKGVKFKPRALERAADAVAALEISVGELADRGGLSALEAIDGVGRGIAERIEEYLQTGRVAEYERMKKALPVDIAGLTAVEGVGPKTVALLYAKLRIRTLAQLERAAKAGQLAKVKGIGVKGEARILNSLHYLREGGERRTIHRAWRLSRSIADKLALVHGVRTIEPVGSVRRMQDTIGDLDWLAATDDAPLLMREFAGLAEVQSVYRHGEHKTLVHFAFGMDGDLSVIPSESWGAALIAWTGSKAHNITLRTLAKKKGLLLDDYGLFRGERSIAGRTEAEVYRKLGMDFIPAELRTDTGEIEAAQKHELPRLIGYSDLKGDLQVQTDWSDGEHSILKMARAAHAAGLEYIAITDHTKSLTIARGLDEKRIRKQWVEIDRVQKLVPKVKILKGSECDIRRDGSLDLDDAALSRLDVVGISAHTHRALTRAAQTARIIRAMESPHADILFHPTGRIAGERAPYEVDVSALIRAAKRTHTVLEANASERMDLHDTQIREATRAGVPIAVDSDAHQVDGFADLRWGIGQARRGWARKSDVINTRPWQKMLKLLK